MPLQTLTQQTLANHNEPWPGCDKLYIEFNVYKHTLAQQTKANVHLVLTTFDILFTDFHAL